MKVSYIVKRYIAILGRLSNNKKANFEQLIDAILRIDEEDMSISKRTFQRMINDIEDLFLIKIKCNREGFYYIEENQSEFDSSKIVQSLHFFNYQKYLENFEHHIAYDKSCMKGQELIFDIQQAIKDKICVEFEYTKYKSTESISEHRLIAPYGLKEYRGRWYMVGKDMDKQEIRIFGLDRMSNLQCSVQKMIIQKDFDIHRFFKHSIGISIDENDISEIVELAFSHKLSGYIKNFPLHQSQQIIEESNQGIVIKLRTYINLELINELMQYSDDVKILKPVRLRKMILKRAEDILNNNE